MWHEEDYSVDLRSDNSLEGLLIDTGSGGNLQANGLPSPTQSRRSERTGVLKHTNGRVERVCDTKDGRKGKGTL